MVRILSHVGVRGNQVAMIVLLSWRLGSSQSSAEGRGEYFNRMTCKSPRPWFPDVYFPRCYITLITRLKTSHVCTRAHFCDCGAELKDLKHLCIYCPLLSDGRPRFFSFIAVRFPDQSPEQVNQADLIFDPETGTFGELGRFLRSGSLLI